jgi:uncharacterized repeat protein (TIGR03943 family)
MNRQVQAVVLFLVGGAVLRAGLTDLYLRYVKHGLRPLLIAAGVLLVVVAAATLWAEARRHHDHGGPAVAWLLILPVLGLLLVAPPALGSYAAERAGTALTRTSDDFVPLPAGDPVAITVLDYASRAVYDQGRSLDRRRVALSGFLIGAPHGGWYLTRMILTCCAADARPIKVGLAGAVPDGLREDGWLRVTGRYTDEVDKDPANGETIPFLQVEDAEPIAPPAEQYES